MANTTQERIDGFKAQLAALEAGHLAELHEKRTATLATLKEIEDEIASLTGGKVSKAAKTPQAAKGGRAKKGKSGTSSGGGKSPVADATELKSILAKADGKKLNRKGLNDLGYNLKSAVTLAKADKNTFGFEQNGPQGSVWLK